MPELFNTSIIPSDIRRALNTGSPAAQTSALQKIQAGTQLSKVKVTFAALTSASAQDITSDEAKAAATIEGISLRDDENLPPIGQVVTLRVTTGTLAAGPAVVTDEGGTPTAIGALAVHVATLSDDGTTLTFQAAVTGFVLTYYPAPAVGLDTNFPLAQP